MCAVCDLVCGRQQGFLLHVSLLPAALHEPHQDLRQQVTPLPYSLYVPSVTCSMLLRLSVGESPK